MGPPLPVPPTGHTRPHYGFPVLGSLVPTRAVGRALTGRFVAGAGTDDAVRAAAHLVAGGFRVALEHAPGPDPVGELEELAGRAHAAGLSAACELTLPVDRLGTSGARAVAATAAASGLAVAIAGPLGAARSAARGVRGGVVVVPAWHPDAEVACRDLARGRVRLTAGRGATADLAFVRCLNVLMAGDGHPAVAARTPRLVAITGERAAWNDRPPDSWEYVMSYGIRTHLQQQLLAGGARVRVALPSGPGAATALARHLAGQA